MKFEPYTATAPSPGGADALPPTVRFSLEQEPYAGRTFTVQLRVCPNPVCRCGLIGMTCQPEAIADAPLGFELDVIHRKINTDGAAAPAAVSLGQAFVAEMPEPGWEWIAQHFLNTKRRCLETMDIDALDVTFAPDVLAGKGTMVSYLEIFPWAETFNFSGEGGEWFVNDQHCVRPGCDCTETGLAFFRASPLRGVADEPLRCVTFLFHDYVAGKTKMVEAQPSRARRLGAGFASGPSQPRRHVAPPP
jgi:hypothetical protein